MAGFYAEDEISIDPCPQWRQGPGMEKRLIPDVVCSRSNDDARYQMTIMNKSRYVAAPDVIISLKSIMENHAYGVRL